MQLHVRVAKVLQIFENVPGVLDGAHHDGYIGLLGNFEDTGAEGVHLAVLAGVAFREGTDGNLVLLDELDAPQNGFQGLPVVFPVDGLAEDFVHEESAVCHYNCY